MTNAQIQQVLQNRTVPEKTTSLECIETHVSWVLLADHFAYKIKKPVQFSFLDFSTVAQRGLYCQKEIELNARLTSNVYLEVLPVVLSDQGISIGATGELIDYAVKMRRLDNQRQMDKLLKMQAVHAIHIKQLAAQIAHFHQNAVAIRQPFDVVTEQAKFADLLKVEKTLTKYLGATATRLISEAIALSAAFLNEYAWRLEERNRQGFLIDGHGDLHSGNIFLLDEPVIFDCIEFNDTFRQVDMLDEIAFFCLDLDFYQQTALEQLFLEHYLQDMPCITHLVDWQIFQYYKLYRANVRLKVNCLKARQLEGQAGFHAQVQATQAYFGLFETYIEKIKTTLSPSNASNS